jgi:hypothetical protein
MRIAYCKPPLTRREGKMAEQLYIAFGGEFITATQSEIDAAASPQMREDAEVGKAIRERPFSISHIDVGYPQFAVTAIDGNRLDTNIWAITAKLAIEAAGLLPAKAVTE